MTAHHGDNQRDNRPDSQGDERLRALIHEAVAGVEPRDRLADVRRRTRARRTSSARRWLPVLAGAGAVAATAVAATVVVNGLSDEGQRPDRPPVAGSSQQTSPTTVAAGIYFVSDSPTGPRLYREFQVVGATTDPDQKVLLALRRLTVDDGPRDPDYRTSWPSHSFDAVEVEDKRIVVALGSDAALEATGAPGTARIDVQQAVYTAEAALGSALPVAFERDGRPVQQVLGLRVDGAVERDRSYDVVAPVNISDPGEGLAVEDGTLDANGTMAAFVADVDWTLADSKGDIVLQGRAVPIDITGPDARATLGAPGWESGEIDLAGLPPGTYVFTVKVADIGQTSDSPRIFTDTRTINVR